MEKQKKALLFFLVCIPLRLAMAWVSFKYTQSYPIVSAMTGIVIGTGFIVQHFTGKDKGAFGGDVTWSRSLHGAMFLAFALVSFLGGPAYAILLADVIYGGVTHATTYL